MPQGVLALREIRSGEGPQEGPRAVTRSFWKVGLEEGIRWPAWVAEETPRSPLLVAAWAEEAGPRTRKIPSVAVWPEVGPCRPQAAAWAEEHQHWPNGLGLRAAAVAMAVAAEAGEVVTVVMTAMAAAASGATTWAQQGRTRRRICSSRSWSTRRRTRCKRPGGGCCMPASDGVTRHSVDGHDARPLP